MKNKNNLPLALVDADTIIWTAALKETGESFFGEDLESDVEQQKRQLKSYIKWLKDTHLQGYWLIFCISDPDANFRKDLLPEYKSNRKDSRKPETLDELKLWFKDYYNALMEPTLEADDLVAILATETPGSCIVGVDKDFLQVPHSTYFNQRKQEWDKARTEHEGLHWLYLQVLHGDTCDGYRGIPGVGIKRALAILDGVDASLSVDDYHTQLWLATLEAFESRGLTKEYAISQGQVAYLLKHGDYCWDTKQITPWSPPV